MNPQNETQRTEPQDKRTPEQIEADIQNTKSAIAEEIKALGEKISPEHLREGARHIMQDAKEEAKEVIREAKDAAADSLRSAKEHAMESVTETLDEVKARARRVTTATTSYVSANAIPLTLLGVGAGWLIYSMRKQRGQDYYPSSSRYPTDSSQAYRQQDRTPGLYGEGIGQSDDLASRGRSAVGRLADRAKESGTQLVERAQDGAHQLSDRAMGLTHRVGERAADLGHRAGERLGRAQERTVEFAHDNPLVIGALAVAAGVGIGFALPTSRTENRLLGPTRDRIAREVTDTAQQVKRVAQDTAQHAARAAQGTVDEIKNSLSQPGTFR
jgi:ElaB/YqjD/DUF883 family membrane-anchored ribosome-binding protein